MERVHRPSAAFVQVRLHLSTLAGLEELPQPGVSNADDHSVERKADSTECQLSIYTPVSSGVMARLASRCDLAYLTPDCTYRARLRACQRMSKTGVGGRHKGIRAA